MAVRSTTAPAHEEHYHLIIWDPTCTRVLMTITDRTWFIPFIRSHAHLHPWPAIVRRLAMHGITAMPVHAGFLPESPPTQEGRPGAWHHYLALVADAWPRNGPLVWVPPDESLQRRRCLHPVQRLALDICLARIREGDAPFDRPSQLRAVCAWVQDEVRHANGGRITGPPVPVRVGRYDSVLRFQTTKGPVLFKGGPKRTRRDAKLLRQIHTMSPENFPAPIAEDASRNWWLMPASPGNGQDAAHVTAEDEDAWFNMVTLLAETQRRTLKTPGILDLVAAKPFGAGQLDAALEQLRSLLSRGQTKAQWPATRIATLGSVLHRAVHRLMGHDLPWTWTPSCFTIANLHIRTGGGRDASARTQLEGPTRGAGTHRAAGSTAGTDPYGSNRTQEIDTSGITFGDAEECYFAPPTLALSQFMDDLCLRAQVPALTLVRLEQRYIDAWGGAISAPLLRRALADTHIAGLLFTFASHVDCLASVHGLDVRSLTDLAHPELIGHAHAVGSRVPSRLPRQPKGRASLNVLPDATEPGWRGC